jgi:hypothetical protein
LEIKSDGDSTTPRDTIPTRFQHWDQLFAFEYQLFAFNSKKIRTCGGLFNAKKFPLRGLTLATQTLTEVQNFPPPADALGFASEITRRQKNPHLRRSF